MSYPTNISIRKNLPGNFDSALFESVALHSMSIGTRDIEDGVMICVFREGKSFMSLPRYYEEFGITSRFSWGIDDDGSDQLSYAMIRFITNDEELARLLYKQFKYREVMLYGKQFTFTAYELQMKIIHLLKWIT